MYQTAVNGFTCTWLAYCDESSGSRSAGIWSNTQSAWPFSTSVTSASTVSPNFWMITSGLPLGWASFDHSLKYLLRTSLMSLLGLYSAKTYGPVPGGGIATSLFGVLGGSTNANGTPSLSRNSGSARVRWNVSVYALSFGTMPFERSHVAGFFRHLSAPTKTL